MTDEVRDCPACGRTLTIQRFQAGFGNQGFMYCDRDATVVTWSSYDPTYSALAENRHPWTLDESGRERVESAIRSCPCGGAFRFSNPPLCPYCGGDISVLEPTRTYVLVVGRRLDGEAQSIWRE